MADSSVHEWVQFAKMDYNTAKHLYQTMYPKPLEIICYHCQQAAEKLLKAIIINYGGTIEKTHDLGLLAERCAEFVGVSDEIYDLCDNLTPYGVKIRYPDELFLEEHHVVSALADTEELLKWFEGLNM